VDGGKATESENLSGLFWVFLALTIKPVMNGVKFRRPFSKLFHGRFPFGLSKNCLSQYANQGMQLHPLEAGEELS
jgi:hypothetical protein